MAEDESDTGSEVCFAHLLVDGHVVDPQTASDVARFRNAERGRLYQLRKQVPSASRAKIAGTVANLLDEEIGPVKGLSIAAYWPIRGELNLRDWMVSCHSRGATVGLPVVTKKNEPVEFHQWSPDQDMIRGVWDIPVPREDIHIQPDIVIVPLLGVDQERFRLGNGGGYYDRTLSRIADTTRIIGVGHDFCQMDTVFPMPWDIPMDKVILSDGSIF